jgi:hypothetical protein
LQQKIAAFVAPPTLALALNLIVPATTDVVLMLLYIGYGCVLIRTALRGVILLFSGDLAAAVQLHHSLLSQGSFSVFPH